MTWIHKAHIYGPTHGIIMDIIITFFLQISCNAVSRRNINKAQFKQQFVCLHSYQQLQYTLFVNTTRKNVGIDNTQQ